MQGTAWECRTLVACLPSLRWLPRTDSVRRVKRPTRHAGLMNVSPRAVGAEQSVWAGPVIHPDRWAEEDLEISFLRVFSETVAEKQGLPSFKSSPADGFASPPFSLALLRWAPVCTQLFSQCRQAETSSLVRHCCSLALLVLSAGVSLLSGSFRGNNPLL